MLVQSLDDRKRRLDVEDADMHRQKLYLASVTASYAEESVPGGGQSTYEEVFAKYNRRVEKYNTNLAALRRDYAAYNERVNEVNARIRLLNGFR